MAARRPPHRVGHPQCPHLATNWAECDERTREKFGKCQALTEKANECNKWATDQIGERRYCSQHSQSIVEAEVRKHREEKSRAKMDECITEYLLWTSAHPSVWDRRGDGGGGESNSPFPEDPVPSTETVSVGSGGPGKPRTPKVWSASSGDPAPVRPKRS